MKIFISLIVCILLVNISFSQNNCSSVNYPEELAFIPWPQSLIDNGGILNLSSSSVIRYTDPELQELSFILQAMPV